MGKLEDYARREARKRLKDQKTLINQISTTQQSPDTTGRYDDDTDEISLPDGRVLPGSKIGDPSNTDGTLVVGDRAIQAEQKVKYTTTGNAGDAFVILKSTGDGSSNNGDKWVKIVDDPEDYLYSFTRERQIEVCNAPSISEIVSTLFSPNGQHILVGAAVAGNNDGTIQVYWGVIKNFQLSIVDDERIVTWEEEDLIQGEYNVVVDITTILEPDPPPTPAESTSHRDTTEVLLAANQNCTGTNVLLTNDTNLSQIWAALNPLEETLKNRLPVNPDIAIHGRFYLSNTASGEPRVDFIGIIHVVKQQHSVFRMENLTSVSDAVIEQPICCATGNFKAQCLQTTTHTKFSMLTETITAWTISIDQTQTISRSGCVTGNCSGPPLNNPYNTCMTVGTFFPAGCGTQETDTSFAPIPTDLVLTVPVTYPTATFSASGPAPLELDKNIYVLTNKTDVTRKFSVVDLQTEEPIFDDNNMSSIFSTYDLTLDAYDTSTGAFLNTSSMRYTPDLDETELGLGIQTIEQLFRTEAGVIVAVWEGGPISSIDGINAQSYVSSHTLFEGVTPVLATDTHTFLTNQADWSDMTDKKPVLSEAFQAYRKDNTELKLKSYIWDDDEGAVVEAETVIGPRMPTHFVVDYILV
jgi:hypothetical protein